MIRSVVVGPFPIYFGNVNVAMNLRGHYHTAAVTLHYGYREGQHGYPSFRETNDAIRDRLRALTKGIFRDATNEDVAARLWDDLRAWVAEPWRQWGGEYWLHRLDLDVEGVHDDIGHDSSVTRYTVELDMAVDMPVFLPGGRQLVHEAADGSWVQDKHRGAS